MTTPRDPHEQVIETSVDVYVRLVVISLIAYLALQFVGPFILVLLWATILAVAIYPVFTWLRGKLGGRSGLSATLIAVVGLAILITPTVMAVQSMVETLGGVSAALSQDRFSVPPPDEGVKAWPLVGGWVYDLWTHAHENLGSTIEQFAPHIEETAVKLISTGAGLLTGVLQFALSIVFAAVFMSFASPLVAVTTRVAQRVGSDRGHEMLKMAGATIQNVSRGVLGVALLQGMFAAIGIFVYGLPVPGVLAALTLMLCIVQAPPLAFIPMIIYAWSVDGGTATVLFTIYMVAVMFLDNVLKPILMGRGLTTPMIVILIGVLGGTLTSGMLGLFIGPVVLALFYEMVMVWATAAAEPLEEAPVDD